MRHVPALIRATGLAIFLFAPALCAQPQFRNAGALLVAETVANKVIESGERVTVSLALKNIGNQTASNLVATVRAGSAVAIPLPPTQTYGLLMPSAPSVAREFQFTANAPSDSLLFVNLDLADSGRYLGTVTFRFRVGPHITWAANPTPIVISDQDMATPYPSIISISNVPGTIVDVSVTLSNLWHTFPDDLDILLVSPSDDSVVLMSDACGTSDFDYLTLTFNQYAANVLPNQGLPTLTINRATNYAAGDPFPVPAPVGPTADGMSAFNGKTANGDWRLFILDDSAGDSGGLANGWSLNIITLQQMDAAPILILLGRTANNTISLAVTGRPHYSYAIETSPDPVQSFPLETFIMPASGMRTFEFPLEAGNRFFRAATDP